MPNKLSQFWQELKRRNVVRVITVYAGAAFVIIELTNNITEPLRLPEWTPTLVIVLLAIGFPVVIIFSWIYDVHPEGGMIKTEPVDKVREQEKPTSSNSWKIASYISFVVIVGLIVLNVIPRTGRKENLEKSIAILQVRNLGGDPGQDPICAGLTSEIISQLAKIKSFDKIVPFQSVMSIEPGMNAPEIAEKFGVNYILGINYLKVGDQFSLNFSLIEPRENNTIWQDDVERKYEEIISINKEIALGIAKKLNAYISKDEERLIENVSTTQNLEAYELYQSIAYQFYTKFNTGYPYKDSLLKVTELDPDWAEPWALMATVSIFQSVGAPLPGFNRMDAIEYNQKAWAIDPENLTVFLNQSLIEQCWNWNYVAAEDNYLKAFKIAPNTTDSILISNYISFLFWMNRYEEIPPWFSRMSKRHAIEMDVYAALGQQEKAEAAIQGLIEEGNIWPVARYYIWRGEYERAKALDITYSLQNRFSLREIGLYAELCVLRTMTGDISEAEGLIKFAESWDNAIGKFILARYYSAIGDTESAFKYLLQAYDGKFFGMFMLKADPLFDNIREDDRFRDLYAKVGLKDYDDYMARRKD